MEGHNIYDTRKPSMFPDGQFWIMFVMAIMILICFVSSCSAQEFSDEQIANAIYKAENSVKYPYGIKSLKYEDRTDKSLTKEQWARKICLNTIKNHRKRHAKHNCGKDFISCLGDRYCPTTIKSEYHLNKNWVKSVKFFLTK